MDQWRAALDLPATVGAAATARHIVSAVLRSWHLATLVSDAEPWSAAWSRMPSCMLSGAAVLELHPRRMHDGVWIRLSDGSAVRPILRDVPAEVPTGRGMQIVEKLAAQWGVDSHDGGKRVWVHLLA